MNKGSLTVLSGFSGAGKGSIMKKLIAAYPNYALSISCTTREPRPGEKEANAYEFITQEEFDRRVAAGELLEHAGYVGHSYGTPARFVREKIEEGRDVLLEIEVQGAAIVKKKMPEAILLFVMPESAEVLQHRLSGRGTEDAETVRKRLEQARFECEQIPQYDAIIVNREGQLEEAVEQVHHTIQTLKTAPSRNGAFVQQWSEDLRRLHATV